MTRVTPTRSIGGTNLPLPHGGAVVLARTLGIADNRYLHLLQRSTDGAAFSGGAPADDGAHSTDQIPIARIKAGRRQTDRSGALSKGGKVNGASQAQQGNVVLHQIFIVRLVRLDALHAEQLTAGAKRVGPN